MASAVRRFQLEALSPQVVHTGSHMHTHFVPLNARRINYLLPLICPCNYSFFH